MHDVGVIVHQGSGCLAGAGGMADARLPPLRQLGLDLRGLGIDRVILGGKRHMPLTGVDADDDGCGPVMGTIRDILDLAMLQPTPKTWSAAVQKAEDVYGVAVLQSLKKARARLLADPQCLARCIEALQVSTPQALLYQRRATLP